MSCYCYFLFPSDGIPQIYLFIIRSGDCAPIRTICQTNETADRFIDERSFEFSGDGISQVHLARTLGSDCLAIRAICKTLKVTNETGIDMSESGFVCPGGTIP